MNLVSEHTGQSFTTVKFIRNYTPWHSSGLRPCEKGETVEVKVWMAACLMELGYVIWKRGVR